VKTYFLVGLPALALMGCLGDFFNDEEDLYSDVDLLGIWEITQTTDPPNSQTDTNELEFRMENGEVALYSIVSNPGSSSEMDLISDPTSPLTDYPWSISAAGHLELRLEFEVSENEDFVEWARDYSGWLDLTKQSVNGTFEHESFRNTEPEDSYSGTFNGIKKN